MDFVAALGTKGLRVVEAVVVLAVLPFRNILTGLLLPNLLECSNVSVNRRNVNRRGI